MAAMSFCILWAQTYNYPLCTHRRLVWALTCLLFCGCNHTDYLFAPTATFYTSRPVCPCVGAIALFTALHPQLSRVGLGLPALLWVQSHRPPLCTHNRLVWVLTCLLFCGCNHTDFLFAPTIASYEF